jgi:hypothetical protein
VPAPTIDLAECAAHFGVDAEAWKAACASAAGFYGMTAPLRYDPTARLAKSDRYGDACRKLNEGRKAEDLGVAGIGLRPVREWKSASTMHR